MRARVGAAALLVAVIGIGLSGCNFFVDQWTTTPYDPSDGVSTRVGDVRIINALVVSDTGDDGNFVATAVNTGSNDVELVLQYESRGNKVDVSIELDADSTTQIGFGPDGQLLLDGIYTTPGSLISIYLQYGDEQGRQIQVPVLDGSLPIYSDLLPTPVPTDPPA